MYVLAEWPGLAAVNIVNARLVKIAKIQSQMKPIDNGQKIDLNSAQYTSISFRNIRSNSIT
jgi:hypothetical protein